MRDRNKKYFPAPLIILNELRANPCEVEDDAAKLTLSDEIFVPMAQEHYGHDYNTETEGPVKDVEHNH